MLFWQCSTPIIKGAGPRKKSHIEGRKGDNAHKGQQGHIKGRKGHSGLDRIHMV